MNRSQGVDEVRRRCPECGEWADGPHRDPYGGHCAGEGTDPGAKERRRALRWRSRRQLVVLLVVIVVVIASYFVVAFVSQSSLPR